MVFATEYDPFDRPQHRQADSDKTASIQPAQLAAQPHHSPTALPARPGESKVVPLQLGGPAVRVSALPDKPKLPLGLKLLDRIQQGSTIITGLLVTGALAIYGSTVYVDKASDRAMAQLDALQGESQQLTSANEALKQSLAEQATQPESGLEPYEAGDVLFLSPEPRREAAKAEERADEIPHPMGY